MQSAWTELGSVTLLSTFVRLLLAALFGGIIGIERGRKRRPAGLRTHMLVCMGSALVMITNQFVAQQYPGVDPARLGAQVISGIGFLGAGTILVTRNQQVKGLTTAAGLWASACMGLAVGIGFYSGALVACGFIILIMLALDRIDNMIVTHSRTMEIYTEFEAPPDLSRFLGYLSNHSLKVSYMELVSHRSGESHSGSGIAALLTLRLPKRFDHVEVLRALGNAPGLKYIDEI